MNYYYTEYINKECKEIEIRGSKTEQMPIWVINNYVKSTCDNYAKLLYIWKIIDIFSKEDTDIVDIGVSIESVPVHQDGMLFEEKLLNNVQSGNKNKKYCLMKENTGKDEKGFWHYFANCDRPVCFALTQNEEVIFLYNPRSAEGIKVCDISYHSPIDMNWGGFGHVVEHLLNAGSTVRNDRRLQDEHEARMLTQALQTVNESITIQERLHNTNLPDGQKQYIQHMHDAIMAKQEKLNRSIGIERPGVDIRG